MSAPLLSNEDLLAQNVQPRAETPGMTQESSPSHAPSGPPASGGGLASFMPILLMVVVFLPLFFMMSRRQRKEAKARESLKRGDRVTTNSGLIGELVEMDERIAKVKISPSVTVQMVASTISPFTESEKASTGKELKEAKVGSDKK